MKTIYSISSSKKNRLISLYNKFPPGLTFLKDYGNSNILGADYAKGDGTSTYTASRSATNPATYIDANGTIQLVTTSNIPRYNSGYYDETGFHTVDSNGQRVRGLVIEGAGTNLFVS